MKERRSKLAILTLLLSAGLRSQDQPVAFVDVSVVAMDREGFVEHETVLVRDGRIQEVGRAETVQVPAGFRRIDGKGRFLMPGLSDMHVHFVREALPKLPAFPQTPGVRAPGIPASASADHDRENRAYALMFLANGITTVRNMWGGSQVIQTLAKEIEAGRTPGPYIYSTGPITDGNPPNWFSTRIVETSPQAEAAVAEDKRNGYVAIKVYSLLSPEAYAAIVAAARRVGLPVVGHVPQRVGLEGAIAAKQDSVEHLDAFLPAIQPGGGASGRLTLADAVKNADFGRIPSIARAIADAGVIPQWLKLGNRRR